MKTILVHTFPPLISPQSQVLILGSFPSVISRKEAFYYANRQNRFWKIMFALFNEPYSEETEKRKELILKNKLALYDVVQSCTVEGSMDSSLKDIILADLPSLIGESQIHAIFLNGKKAYELYCRKPLEGIPFYLLPSSSPANAVYSLEDLEKAYAEIKRHLV